MYFSSNGDVIYVIF